MSCCIVKPKEIAQENVQEGSVRPCGEVQRILTRGEGHSLSLMNGTA